MSEEMVEELRPGSYVTKAIRLVRPLAEGGMGRLWIAEHEALGTQVVVKFMAEDLEGRDGATERFAREAAIAAAVRSPHVVTVFDSGTTDDGRPYIVMEKLDGCDLALYLQRYGRMPARDALSLVSQLALALAKAHEIGIVHRDLKPENVFLCEPYGGERFVKLLDFGTAKRQLGMPVKTTTGQLVGTPYYMSPEQIIGEPTDARSDLWSLGVVAFEVLTGRRPFEGSTVGAITLAIHTARAKISAIAPELPSSLDAWFERACARERTERFQDARAMADAFLAAFSLQGQVFRGRVDTLPLPDLVAPPEAYPSVAAPPPSFPSVPPPESYPSMAPLSASLLPPERARSSSKWIIGGTAFAMVSAILAVVTHQGGSHAASASSPVSPPASTQAPPVMTTEPTVAPTPAPPPVVPSATPAVTPSASADRPAATATASASAAPRAVPSATASGSASAAPSTSGSTATPAKKRPAADELPTFKPNPAVEDSEDEQPSEHVAPARSAPVPSAPRVVTPRAVPMPEGTSEPQDDATSP
ncbi:Serine/threonine protein kinase [Labilithrix luteola]|uniref:Serine/threonine protein kinase n=1 Tax=Labilithrix luteola TaxID=1391654 RepID=A0A0K1PYF1_9BACT|nr:serine/threonine-protein kinase [Labilithrix luteola]AKU98532.1 Serine/threonine protein kinase [Labilithrix luteola]